MEVGVILSVLLDLHHKQCIAEILPPSYSSVLQIQNQGTRFAARQLLYLTLPLFISKQGKGTTNFKIIVE